MKPLGYTLHLITLTTDFGAGGRYVAQLKGVLYARAPGVTVVDLSHDVPPQDVAAAARLLREASRYWPDGTTHLAVVDPGVGTDRPIVLIDAGGQRFVGPDNGLFGWLAEGPDARPIDAMVILDPRRIEPAGDSATFHGRDLMAPAAARLALGADVSELGTPHAALQPTPRVDAPRLFESRIEGEVAEIDRYGNLITNVPIEALEDTPLGDALRITTGEHETFGLWHAYAEQPPQTLVALVGSGGYVELAIVNGDAAAMLGAAVGDAVVLDWSPRT